MSLADLMKKGSLQGFATTTVATVATDRPNNLPSVASVATVNVATARKDAANDPGLATCDPDRWCWPHTVAMNTREIDIFTARVVRFTAKGLGLDDADALADKLLKRDRDLDERRLCLECINLTRPRGAWSCTKWRAAGLGEVRVPSDLMQLLQRCDAFNAFDHGHQSFW